MDTDGTLGLIIAMVVSWFIWVGCELDEVGGALPGVVTLEAW